MLQFLPIPVGGALMLALKSLRVGSSRVRIDTSAKDPGPDKKGEELPTAIEAEERVTSYHGLELSASSKRALAEDSIAFAGTPDQATSWKGYICHADDSARAIFDQMVRETLIVNCIFNPDRRSDYTEHVAFSRLGIAEIGRLPRARSRWEGPRPLQLFVRNGSEFLSDLMVIGRRSGLLLAYMADSRLDLIGVGNELHRKYD